VFSFWQCFSRDLPVKVSCPAVRRAFGPLSGRIQSAQGHFRARFSNVLFLCPVWVRKSPLTIWGVPSAAPGGFETHTSRTAASEPSFPHRARAARLSPTNLRTILPSSLVPAKLWLIHSISTFPFPPKAPPSPPLWRDPPRRRQHPSLWSRGALRTSQAFSSRVFSQFFSLGMILAQACCAWLAALGVSALSLFSERLAPFAHSRPHGLRHGTPLTAQCAVPSRTSLRGRLGTSPAGCVPGGRFGRHSRVEFPKFGGRFGLCFSLLRFFHIPPWEVKAGYR